MKGILLLFGPTASGKTDLIADLFLENRAALGLPEAEIISADSMQVYRGMDIGTAKPDAAFRSRLPHHLIDIRYPCEQFTAGDFVALADEACEGIAARGRLPVVSGGTAFYLKNFLCGMPETPKADAATRQAVVRDLAEEGIEALYGELGRLDPVSASRISPNDAYRITRALEVARFTGRPLSSFAVPSAPRSRWSFTLLSVERPRVELYARIDARVDAMFEAGLETEVRRLVDAGYGRDDPGMHAIGYREFFGHPGDGPSCAVRDAIKADSRKYAKRQLTFFRSLPGVRSVDPGDRDRVAGIVRGAMETA
ncbi:MAG: tRNA (adenosine(37)-N6)-dimethylallyltransferase MiaA [Spirochaetes bacterium]|nr:tRNA (adenosine(37)-N6)-dimethylallyltransferase MiaA [Spirochaetota bacterium]